MTRRTAVSARSGSPTADEDVGDEQEKPDGYDIAASSEPAQFDPEDFGSEKDGSEKDGSEKDGSEKGSDTGVSATTEESPPRTVASRLLALPGLNAMGAALVVLVLAGLSASAIMLGVAHHDSGQLGQRDLAILAAARQDVVNLISPSVKDPVGSTNRIAADATGQWLAEFRGVENNFIGAIDNSKTDSTGEILGAGIERHNSDGSTTVLVTAVSKVSNSAGAKNDPRTWRLRVDVVRAGGGYKLSKVEVVP